MAEKHIRLGKEALKRVWGQRYEELKATDLAVRTAADETGQSYSPKVITANERLERAKKREKRVNDLLQKLY